MGFELLWLGFKLNFCQILDLVSPFVKWIRSYLFLLFFFLWKLNKTYKMLSSAKSGFNNWCLFLSLEWENTWSYQAKLYLIHNHLQCHRWVIDDLTSSWITPAEPQTWMFLSMLNSLFYTVPPVLYHSHSDPDEHSDVISKWSHLCDKTWSILLNFSHHPDHSIFNPF